jgi:AhpC/TSA family/Disulphide bond corrector protein DsbC
LEETKEEFKKMGLGICAVSYDSREVLADFARRKKISYPLLSDPDSTIIRAFGILNTSVPEGDSGYGIPHPGVYRVSEKGLVQAKFFEEAYNNRYALGTVFTRLFGSPLQTHETVVENDQLLLKSFSTADSASMGNRLSLMLDIGLKDKMHVYAPGAQGYRPIELKITESPAFTLIPAEYPRAQTLYLTAIRENAPVYQGQFRLSQDIVLIPNAKKLEESLTTANELVVEGSLSYQACDDKICYLPKAIPLRWAIKIVPPDRERVPDVLRRRK